MFFSLGFCLLRVASCLLVREFCLITFSPFSLRETFEQLSCLIFSWLWCGACTRHAPNSCQEVFGLIVFACFLMKGRPPSGRLPDVPAILNHNHLVPYTYCARGYNVAMMADSTSRWAEAVFGAEIETGREIDRERERALQMQKTLGHRSRFSSRSRCRKLQNACGTACVPPARLFASAYPPLQSRGYCG